MPESASCPHSLAELIQPAAIEHLQRVLDLLADDGPLEAKAIHEIRRSVKRIRAILQLVRSDLKSRASEWDRTLRSVNRALSGARDLEVCRQTVRDLSAESSEPQRAVLDRFHTELSERQTVMLSNDPADLRPELSARLDAVKAGLEAWRPAQTGFALIRPALRRMAKQARRIIRRLRGGAGSEELHSLRKVVKRRLYWLETFEPVWPQGIGEERKRVDLLADRLGKHHDLAVLAQRLSESEVAGDASLHRPVKRVLHRLKRRQHKLERHSLKLARRLFAERPKAMTKRWSSLVSLWQDSPAAGPPGDHAGLCDDKCNQVLHGESA